MSAAMSTPEEPGRRRWDSDDERSQTTADRCARSAPSQQFARKHQDEACDVEVDRGQQDDPLVEPHRLKTEPGDDGPSCADGEERACHVRRESVGKSRQRTTTSPDAGQARSGPDGGDDEPRDRQDPGQLAGLEQHRCREQERAADDDREHRATDHSVRHQALSWNDRSEQGNVEQDLDHGAATSVAPRANRRTTLAHAMAHGTVTKSIGIPMYSNP